MKKLCILSILLILLPILYYLLEPIFIHSTGWTTFPQTKKLQPVATHQDVVSQKADSLLIDIFARAKTPAISVAIGKNGKIVWTNAIGYEDLENKKKVSLKTKFRIGSTSKAVTSVGLGLLLQNKKLNLDSKVKDFVPYANAALSEITLKQLASHTSGIRNYGLCFCFPMWEYYSNDEYATTKESVEIFNNDDLLFSPGTDFSYSTYNYTMLSAMIEGATKMSYKDYMKTALFKPLNLDISIEKQTGNIKHLSKFYEIDANKYKEVYKVDNSYKWAGGGLIATPTALVTLGNTFLNHTLLTKETMQSLTQPVTLQNGEINEQYYAIGWRNHVSETFTIDETKVRVIHHGGTANGSTSILLLFPEYNTSISLLVNKSASSSDLFKYSYELSKLFI